MINPWTIVMFGHSGIEEGTSRTSYNLLVHSTRAAHYRHEIELNLCRSRALPKARRRKRTLPPRYQLYSLARKTKDNDERGTICRPLNEALTCLQR